MKKTSGTKTFESSRTGAAEMPYSLPQLEELLHDVGDVVVSPHAAVGVKEYHRAGGESRLELEELMQALVVGEPHLVLKGFPISGNSTKKSG